MSESNQQVSQPSVPRSEHFDLPELKKLSLPAKTAWGTIALFIFSIAGWISVGYLGINGEISVGLAVALNAIFAYLSFTVMHDASHRAVSQSTFINDLIGRISVLLLIPMPVFKLFRFVHMQHHRFANESRHVDPDAWTSSGHPLTYPFKWLTLDLYYFWYYFPLMHKRPKAEKRDLLISIGISVVGVSLIAVSGYFMEFLLFWILPSRFAIFFLAYAFDYLPHIPKKTTQRENPYQATNNRIGWESVMTPIFLYQNYHLIHHLYPRVPFYRYLKIWRLSKWELKNRGALSLDWRGREVH